MSIIKAREPDPTWRQLASGLYVPPLLRWASPRRFAGNPCCCCHYMADSFDRGDSSDLGSRWTEVAGDWEISSNVLTLASSDGICTSTTTGDLSYVVRVLVKGSDNDEPKVIVDYTDSNNHTFIVVEYHTATSSRLKLVTVSGGVETEVENVAIVGLDGDEWVWVKACVTDDYISVMTNIPDGGSGFEVLITEFLSPSSGTVGLGTGNIDTAAFFDRFSFQKHRDQLSHCPDCDLLCTKCDDGVAPAAWKVVIDLIEVNGCGADCLWFNRTFILDEDYAIETVSGVPNACVWTLSIPLRCGLDEVRLVVFGSLLRVNLWNGTFGVAWQKSFLPASTVACNALEDEAIPYLADVGFACDNLASATCKITSL